MKKIYIINILLLLLIFILSSARHIGEAIGYSIFILTITYIMLNKKVKILNFSEKILVFLSFVFIGSLCVEFFQKFYQGLSERNGKEYLSYDFYSIIIIYILCVFGLTSFINKRIKNTYLNT